MHVPNCLDLYVQATFKFKKNPTPFTVAFTFKCVLFRHNYSWFRKKKKKKFVTSDQTSKQRIYITFYICRKCLKKNPSKSKCIPQKEIAEASCISLQFSSTHCQHQHHILAELCFSYSYAVPFEVTLGKPVWYQSPPYTLVIWIWMFFLPCLSLEKQLQNLYQVISLECKERDIINPLFHLFRNWGEHHNIQVVE